MGERRLGRRSRKHLLYKYIQYIQCMLVMDEVEVGLQKFLTDNPDNNEERHESDRHEGEHRF
jgi:hypothetical protein